MKKITVLLLFMLVSLAAAAQEIKELRDTLREAVVTAEALKARPAGLTRVDLHQTRQMVTAMGESDVIKYIQTLPGISSGVEGTTSFYVRGGNLGNNVVTLDGVRLYGYGHLLGITTVFPSNIVDNVDFNVGGFDAESSNLLASHIKVSTKEGNFNSVEAEGSISNFIISGYASAPIIKEKLAITASARISPVNLEYNMFESLLEKNNAMFEDVEGNVYDLFAKVSYKPAKNHFISGSVFYSKDDFGYGDYDNGSFDNLGWNNFVANLQWKYSLLDDRLRISASASYNDYSSNQRQEKELSGVYNELTIKSLIKETSATVVADGVLTNNGLLTAKIGARYNGSEFNPGSSRVYGEESSMADINKTKNSLTTIFGQLRYGRDRWHLMAAARYNIFRGDKNGADYKVSKPEISVSGGLMITDWMKLEATYDRLEQFYHTLEGIPLGWSVDMIVPSNGKVEPENSSQIYAGLAFSFNDHTFSIGGYTKDLDNIIYFEKASEFFSSAASRWSDFIQTGKGTSYGIETLYEKRGERLNYKIAYTYSKTDRTFDGVNRGETFLAKYDRPHVLNVTGDYVFRRSEKNEMGVNLQFTYQSGNMETVKSGTYIAHLPGWEYDIEVDWYSGKINNYRMPAYTRLDIGWWGTFYGKRLTHTVKAGIYNVFNRHNHFSLYYDNDERDWKQVYLFPIMPSLSYTISF